MEEKIQKGQRFRFLKDTNSIALHGPLGRGFEAPVERARQTYDPKLLGQERIILTTDLFIAHAAYCTILQTWCVEGWREDGFINIRFLQRLTEEDPPEEFLEIEIIPSPIYDLAKACEKLIGKNYFDALVEMTDFDEALGFAFTILIECGVEDPEEFLRDKGILE